MAPNAGLFHTSSLQFVSDKNNVTLNTSLHQGCMEVRFSEMEYLPWNNPDNILSAEEERMAQRIKDNALGFLFLIGGPANIINMAVFHRQGLRDRVNLCLFALSLADELFLIMAMACYSEQLYLQFFTNERYGPVITFLVNNNLNSLMGFGYVSAALSTIIAVERCYCVLNPLTFQTVMRTRTMAAIILVVYVITTCLYFIVSFRARIGCVYDPESGAVFNTPVLGEFYQAHTQLVDVLDGVVFGAVLPWVQMIVMMTATITTVVKLRQIVAWRAGTSSALSAKEVALTKMLVGNSIFFIVCVCVPDGLLRFSWLLFPEMNSGRRHHNFFLTTLWVTELCKFVNSTCNIFVYYAMGSHYRETFWTLFSRKVDSDRGSVSA